LNVGATNGAYVYPSGRTKDLTLPARSRIRFDNTETNNGTAHSFTVTLVWDSGAIKANDGDRLSPEMGTPGATYTYNCTVHPTTMNGTIHFT
jgi:plastocyanin